MSARKGRSLEVPGISHGNAPIPMVPRLLNTYYQPNVPGAARCHDIGRQLRRTIEADGQDLRVAIVGSGGLSHFVVDEALDRSVIGAFASGDAQLPRSLPRGMLNSGSSEILNWVLATGALEACRCSGPTTCRSTVRLRGLVWERVS